MIPASRNQSKRELRMVHQWQLVKKLRMNSQLKVVFPFKSNNITVIIQWHRKLNKSTADGEDP